METEKDWINGYKTNIFSFYKIWKVKRAIKKGEKTAKNYCILAEWYSLFDVFNIKPLIRKSLYYALKAIRSDRNYAPAYFYAGEEYTTLKTKSLLGEKYLLKAIELGGDDYYLPKLALFWYFVETEKWTEAYKIGTEFLNHKVQSQEYWAMALPIIASYYGYCIEYKIAIKKCINHCIKNRCLPNFTAIFGILMSFTIICYAIHSKNTENTGSPLLDHILDSNNYELQLLLSNKLIIRKKRDNKKNNKTLGILYLLKADALMNKENCEYEYAMKSLDKFKEYEGDKSKDNLDTYYYLRASFAYKAHDYANALIYVNEALLNNTTGRNFLLKGRIAHILEQYDVSKDAFIEAIKYDDSIKETAYYYISENLYALGKHKEALHYINQALLINQDSLNYFAKANILEALGKIKESQECFEKYNKIKEEENQ